MLFDRVYAAWLRFQLRLALMGMTTIITVNSFRRQRRMSHENGVLCRGTFRVVDDPEFPDHEFFTPGREFPCRLRHGTVLFKDDAKMTVRSAAIKLDDTHFESPFDMLMNTGEIGLFWTARMFVEFGFITGKHGKNFLPYLRKYPRAVTGGGMSSRRNPSSFAALSFHSQTCFGFVDRAGVEYYAKYRLVGEDWDGTDSGALEPWWRDHNWLQNPYRDEHRTRNYLKDEITDRLAGDGTVTYRFQMQLRRRPPGPDPAWVSAGHEWDDEEVAPWLDVAVITLTEALDHREQMLTWFDLDNAPPSLPVPMGVSLDDPHSMNNFRSAGRFAARARLLSYRLRGMPPAFSDDRDDPDWIGLPPMPDPPPREALTP